MIGHLLIFYSFNLSHLSAELAFESGLSLSQIPRIKTKKPTLSTVKKEDTCYGILFFVI